MTGNILGNPSSKGTKDIQEEETGTLFPIFDSSIGSIAAKRHKGESLRGTIGTINKTEDLSEAKLKPVFMGKGRKTRTVLRFSYHFKDGVDLEEFVGAFFSLGRVTVEPVCPLRDLVSLHHREIRQHKQQHQIGTTPCQ